MVNLLSFFNNRRFSLNFFVFMSIFLFICNPIVFYIDLIFFFPPLAVDELFCKLTFSMVIFIFSFFGAMFTLVIGIKNFDDYRGVLLVFFSYLVLLPSCRVLYSMFFSL